MPSLKNHYQKAPASRLEFSELPPARPPVQPDKQLMGRFWRAPKGVLCCAACKRQLMGSAAKERAGRPSGPTALKWAGRLAVQKTAAWRPRARAARKPTSKRTQRGPLDSTQLDLSRAANLSRRRALILNDNKAARALEREAEIKAAIQEIREIQASRQFALGTPRVPNTSGRLLGCRVCVKLTGGRDRCAPEPESASGAL